MINSFELSSPRRRVIRRLGTSPIRVVSRRIEAARNLALLALNNAVGQWIHRSSRRVLVGQRRYPDQSAVSREEFHDHVD
jgi:hypothetical protein